MARTLNEIFSEAKAARNDYLRLTEISNPSKMSILDAITWVTSVCICAFENILDVFQVQIAEDINNRINGTPEYYAQALLKFQTEGTLVVSDDGLTVAYDEIDESKRIVTKVAYAEVEQAGFADKQLFMKIAQGSAGSYSQIDSDTLADIRDYMHKISFAGTNLKIVSRIGDVLMPYVVVYYDGGIAASTLKANVVTALNEYVASLAFNGVIYVQKIVDAIQAVEHVNDVQISGTYNGETLGVFVAQYDDDGILGEEVQVDRYTFPNSGYVKESSGTGAEGEMPTWSETIYPVIENPTSSPVA